MNDKPLFIPLKTQWFNQFKDGSKTDELRRYGPGWNENTCTVGRRVTLSKGYGKYERLSGTITKFKKRHGTTFNKTFKAAIEDTYGTLDVDVAVISIELDT